MDKNVKKKRRSGGYPWDLWFSRPNFVLRRGVNYSCMIHGMGQMVRNQAFRRNLGTKIKIHEDGRIDVHIIRPKVVKEVKNA